ncbi:MAG: hypothetical protein QM766_27685 [Burkholderiaceae bacterium]
MPIAGLAAAAPSRPATAAAALRYDPRVTDERGELGTTTTMIVGRAAPVHFEEHVA